MFFAASSGTSSGQINTLYVSDSTPASGDAMGLEIEFNKPASGPIYISDATPSSGDRVTLEFSN